MPSPPTEYLSVGVDTLTPHPDNARTGNVDLIADSLQSNGQYRPIVVQASTNYVLAGNHTLQAAKLLGWDVIDIVRVDVDDDRARRILLVDNRANDVAGYDDTALADLLAMLAESEESLTGTGYTDTDLTDLLDILRPPTLDQLADQHGDHDPESVWPVLRFKIAPSVRDRYLTLVEGMAGSDADLFAALLGWAETGKANVAA